MWFWKVLQVDREIRCVGEKEDEGRYGKGRVNVLAHVVHEVKPDLFHLVEYCIETICIVGEGIRVGNWMDDVETAIWIDQFV